MAAYIRCCAIISSYTALRYLLYYAYCLPYRFIPLPHISRIRLLPRMQRARAARFVAHGARGRVTTATRCLHRSHPAFALGMPVTCLRGAGDAVAFVARLPATAALHRRFAAMYLLLAAGLLYSCVASSVLLRHRRSPRCLSAADRRARGGACTGLRTAYSYNVLYALASRLYILCRTFC